MEELIHKFPEAAFFYYHDLDALLARHGEV
jgi:hypothetical protein